MPQLKSPVRRLSTLSAGLFYQIYVFGFGSLKDGVVIITAEVPDFRAPTCVNCIAGSPCPHFIGGTGLTFAFVVLPGPFHVIVAVCDESGR